MYSFVPSFRNIEANHGVVFPELRGIGRASTFTGFCSGHDDKIFAPIEKTEFAATPQQCFPLGYRALAREVYTKTAAAAKMEYLHQLDRGRAVPEQIALQQLVAAPFAGGPCKCRLQSKRAGFGPLSLFLGGLVQASVCNATGSIVDWKQGRVLPNPVDSRPIAHAWCASPDEKNYYGTGEKEPTEASR